MTDNFWKKVDYIFGLLPFMAIFGVLVVCANIEIKDLDIWLHIGMGKFITLNGFVPSYDILSCAIGGAPWINHEWLFQVIVYNIYNAFGTQGLTIMQVTLVSLTMLILLFLGYSKERQLLTTIVLFLLFMVYQQRFTMRPDLYSLLFFSIYIFVLSLHIDKRWATPVLFIVQILWSNMHGFFFFGPLFVLIGIFSECVKRVFQLPYQWNESGRLTDDEYGRIKAIFIFVCLACFFNPLFIEGALYPISVFFSFSGENKIFFKHIQELQNPIKWKTLFNQNYYLYYKMMIVFSFLSFVFNRRRIDISALLFWLIFLIFSLNASRNMPFFAFAAYLVFITNFLNVNYEDIVPIRFSEKKFFYLTSIVLKILFVLWMLGYYQKISFRSYYDFDKYELKSEYGGISQRTYPNKAVDFLVEHNIKGNFFNDFNSGAYLIGRTFPNIKVYIDGRTEVYGGAFFRNYQNIFEKGNAELFDKTIEKHQITGALLNSSRNHIPVKILNHMYNHKDWHVVYFDYDALILLRDVEMNKELINKFKIDLSQWEAPKTDLFKLGTLRVRPYRHYYRGYTLESLGLDNASLDELKEAIGVDPFYADVHDLMGKIYAKKKEYQKAFEHFRISVTASPNIKEKRHNLALACFDLEQYECAAKQYKQIIRRWPNDPKAYYLLSKSYIWDEKYVEALDILGKAHRLSPKDVRDLLELGDVLYENEAFSEAKDTYLLALETGKQLETIHKKLGLAYIALGDQKQAKEELDKAQELAPDDPDIKEALQGLL